MPKFDAVVLGASGFIGTRLVGDLVGGEGQTVCAIDIEPPRSRVDGAYYERLDVRDPLPPSCGEGAQVIYNLAAVHRTPGHPDQDYFQTNVAGALNCVRLADACGIKTIVFTSSISVYGPSEDTLFESSELKPVSAYGRSKRLAELVHELWLSKGEGRRLVVVRPGVVFGPGERGNYSHLAKALRGGYFFYPGRRDTIKSGGYVDELLRAIKFSLAKANDFTLFNFAYPEMSTTEDIVRTFGEVAGFKRSPPLLPVAPLLAVATVFEAASAVGLRTPIHRARVMKLVQSTKVAPGWLQANGYNFSSNLKSALAHWCAETEGSFA